MSRSDEPTDGGDERASRDRTPPVDPELSVRGAVERAAERRATALKSGDETVIDSARHRFACAAAVAGLEDREVGIGDRSYRTATAVMRLEDAFREHAIDAEGGFREVDGAAVVDAADGVDPTDDRTVGSVLDVVARVRDMEGEDRTSAAEALAEYAEGNYVCPVNRQSPERSARTLYGR